MIRTTGKLTIAMTLVLGSIALGALVSHTGSPADDDMPPVKADHAALTAPPTSIRVQNRNAILSTVTPQPSQTPTLLPPPTFEPPTATPTPSLVPSQTPTPTTDISVSIPGLKGAESPTPTTTPGCEPREDWTLTYTVQFDDALSAIADKYGVWVDELAEGNCITDKNLIVVGQVLRVPGESQPYEPAVECVPWEVMTPFDGSVTVPADGMITFNWRGPLAPKNLIRIYLPDGSVYEKLIELRQNETIDLNEHLSLEGTYTWYVFPLGEDFIQIDCLEGGPWTFYKPQSATATPTMTPSPTQSAGALPG
jgi:LysM repeat protein